MEYCLKFRDSDVSLIILQIISLLLIDSVASSVETTRSQINIRDIYNTRPNEKDSENLSLIKSNLGWCYYFNNWFLYFWLAFISNLFRFGTDLVCVRMMKILRIYHGRK